MTSPDLSGTHPPAGGEGEEAEIAQFGIYLFALETNAEGGDDGTEVSRRNVVLARRLILTKEGAFHGL
jgi:hypothetical protein